MCIQFSLPLRVVVKNKQNNTHEALALCLTHQCAQEIEVPISPVSSFLRGSCFSSYRTPNNADILATAGHSGGTESTVGPGCGSSLHLPQCVNSGNFLQVSS